MKTTLKTLLTAAIFSIVAFTNLVAQCEDHGCNPALNGMEYLSDCIVVGSTATLEIDWLMSGGDPLCTTPAGSWRIQISFPVGEEYGIIDNMTVTGAEFDWDYDAANFTLNGTSNQTITWLEQGTISVVVTGNFDTGCVLTASNANIQIIPNILGGCTDAFDNQTADDNKSASLGIDILDPGLPVDLVAFTAKRQDQTSLLEWTTRAEVNNKGFDILRSEDGTRFEKIGFKAGQQSTAFETNYNFVDTKPFPGINYYKLKQIDNNGDFTMSEIRQVSFDGPAGGKIRFSPNPVVDDIVVDNLLANKIEKIYIMDDANKLVRTLDVELGQDTHKYDLSELNSGIYYIRFVGGENVVTEKLIKLSF